MFNLLGLLGKTLLTGAGAAISKRAFSRSNAQSEKAAMDIKYPGTTPWEQLGAPGASSGSAGGDVASQMMLQEQQFKHQQQLQSQQIAQADKQNVRDNDTSLLRQRMQNVGAWSSEMYRNNGNRSIRDVERMMRNIGITDPSSDVDEHMLEPGMISRSIGHLDAKIWREYASGSADLTRAERDSVEMELADMRYALDAWSKIYGGGFSREFRGLLGEGSTFLQNMNIPHNAQPNEFILKKIFSRILREKGSGPAEKFMEFYYNSKHGVK